MKLSYLATVVALGAGSLGSLALGLSTQGCSSDKTTDTNTEPTNVGGPPTKPTAAAADLSTSKTFALRKLWLGDTDRGDKRDSNAWKKFGYNLDGKNTKSQTATDSCKPNGGPILLDGDNGIDNAFGEAILPVLSNLLNDPSTTASTALNDGTFSILLTINGLTSDPKQTNTDLGGFLYAAGKFGGDSGAKPAWDGNDDWPVRPELLLDQSNPGKGTSVAFPNSFINNGVWTSGGGSAVQLSISLSGVTIDLPVEKAYIVANHDGEKLTNGTVAGILSLSKLKDSITKVSGRINTSACPGKPNYKLVMDTLTSAADLRLDGVFSGECDAISIGIGFEAQSLKAPTRVEAAAAPTADPCATDTGDAGTN